MTLPVLNSYNNIKAEGSHKGYFYTMSVMTDNKGIKYEKKTDLTRHVIDPYGHTGYECSCNDKKGSSESEE